MSHNPYSGKGGDLAISPGEALTALSGINSRLRLWIERQDPTDTGEMIDPPPDAGVLTDLRAAALRISCQADLIESRCRRGEIRADTEDIISRVEEDDEGLAEEMQAYHDAHIGGWLEGEER